MKKCLCAILVLCLAISLCSCAAPSEVPAESNTSLTEIRSSVMRNMTDSYQRILEYAESIAKLVPEALEYFGYPCLALNEYNDSSATLFFSSTAPEDSGAHFSILMRLKKDSTPDFILTAPVGMEDLQHLHAACYASLLYAIKYCENADSISLLDDEWLMDAVESDYSYFQTVGWEFGEEKMIDSDGFFFVLSSSLVQGEDDEQGNDTQEADKIMWWIDVI